VVQPLKLTELKGMNKYKWYLSSYEIGYYRKHPKSSNFRKVALKIHKSRKQFGLLRKTASVLKTDPELRASEFTLGYSA